MSNVCKPLSMLFRERSRAINLWLGTDTYCNISFEPCSVQTPAMLEKLSLSVLQGPKNTAWAAGDQGEGAAEAAGKEHAG